MNEQQYLNQITELEKQLERLRNRFEGILNWGGLGVWSYDVRSRTFDVDQTIFDKYDLDIRLPLTLESVRLSMHPDDGEGYIKTFLNFLQKKGDTIDISYRLRDRSGNWIWFNERGGVTKWDENGVALLAAGTVQNVMSVKEVEQEIQRRDRLLSASNEAARILLEDSGEERDMQIWMVLELLGAATDVDRVYIWKNYYGTDGRHYTTQIYEWSLGADPQQGNEWTVARPVEEAIPTWENIFRSGKCVNNLVRLMPQLEQDQLAPQGIISILVAPIMFKDEFWGFIGFDDCRKERIWSDSEAGILKSAGMIVAAAIMRAETEKRLAAEEALMKQIFETSPVAVAIMTDGVIKRGNQHFFNQFNRNIGDSSLSLYDSPETRQEILRQIDGEGAVFNQEIQLRCGDGRFRDFLLTVLALEYEGRPSQLCWIVDIGELKQIQNDLIVARDLAEAGTRAKSEFLARMSHEIRTPMNAILGMTYLCLQTEVNDQQREYLQKTQTATTNLLGIIDDILDFSKIEAGKVELETIPFHLSNVLQDVVDMIRFKTQDKGLQFISHIDEGVCDDLMGDPLRIRQVLVNITNNAVKFTERGSISITIHNVDDDEKNADPNRTWLEFAVRDSGIGMTPEQVGRLFQSFSQADGSTTRKYGGTGLGLVISKRFVELMGGRIGVESEPGIGSTFRFCVPFDKYRKLDAARLTSMEEHREKELKDCRLLLVDDDPGTREVLRDMIRSFSIQLDTVGSGDAAIAALTSATQKETPYDIMLIDWKMPRMDGLETIRRIRQSDNIALPRMVMISAYDRNECIRQSKGLGLDGFLVKPVSRRMIWETLLAVMERRAAMPVETEKEEKANLQGAKILLVEDNKINQMVASELLKGFGVDLTIAADGRKAVELVAGNDFDLILMDIQMPIMDGLTATKEIRKLHKPGIDRLPILAMTANALDSDYQVCLDVGMNDHLAKPIDASKLRQSLETWIVRK